jgi:hypothetical protein
LSTESKRASRIVADALLRVGQVSYPPGGGQINIFYAGTKYTFRAKGYFIQDTSIIADFRYRGSLALLYPFFGDTGAGISSVPVFLYSRAFLYPAERNIMKYLSFKRKSKVNTDRDSYLDDNGNYVYTKKISSQKGKCRREITCKVPINDENMECIRFLEENDHESYLAERYDAEFADRCFQQLNASYEGDPFDYLLVHMFDEDIHETTNMEKILDFIETLTPDQKNLVYAHCGEKKYLEDIRRAEEAVTGKKITKQAMYNRWNRIIVKGCKFFGVVKKK